MSSWLVNTKSGHCQHPEGIEAYLGQIEQSSYRPIIGPYTSPSFTGNIQRLAEQVTALTDKLESEYGVNRVVWGGITNNNQGQPVTVLGLNTFWTPDPSARANWLLLAGPLSAKKNRADFVRKEFYFHPDGRTVAHFSGITFHYSEACFEKKLTNMFRTFDTELKVERNIDYTLWNTGNWEAGIHSLAQVGINLLCQRKNLKIHARRVRVTTSRSSSFSYA